MGTATELPQTAENSALRSMSPKWGTDSVRVGGSALLIGVSGAMAGVTDLDGRRRE